MRTSAPPLRRLVAFGIDLVTLGWIQSIGGELGAWFGSYFHSFITQEAKALEGAFQSGHQWGGVFWFLAALVLNFGVLQGLTGSSIGKRITGLRVVQDNGELLGVSKSLLRSVLYLYSIVPLYTGVLVMIFHPKRLAIHDLILNTIVEYKPATQKIQSPKVIYLPDRAA